MLIPKGNPLIEDIKLSYTDINIMIGNLEQEGFSGYLMLDYNEARGVFFFLHGGIINTQEIKESEELYRACLVAKFFNKIRKRETMASSYILTPPMASVLSNLYLFRPIYQNQELGKKELPVILNDIEDKAYTGFLSFMRQDSGQYQYILFDKGKYIINNFADKIGQIVCSSQKVNAFMDELSGSSAKIFFYGETQNLLEEKKKEIQKRLNRSKQLIIKSETRFLGKSDLAKIDEYIVREWDVKSPNFLVEFETGEGKTHKIEAVAAKKMGGYIGFSAAFIKKAGLREGDLVNVNPVE